MTHEEEHTGSHERQSHEHREHRSETASHEHRPVHRPHEHRPAPARQRPKSNVWMFAAIFIAGALLMSLFFHFKPAFTDCSSKSTNPVSLDVASKNALAVIKNSLVPEGTAVNLLNSSEKNGVYNLQIGIDEESVEVYVSPDGKLMFTGSIDLDNPPDISGAGASASAAEPIDDPDVLLDDDEIKGDPDAPVTIVEFSDFECPYCGMFYQQAYQQILSEYVDEGLVKIVFRDYPLPFHEDAQKAAEAAECAGDQGKFYDMHDMLFENQDSLSVSDLKKYAKELGLNTAKFNDCLDSGKYEEEVQMDAADGSAYGVSGTPAFFVNGRLMEGALPFDQIAQVIEEELGYGSLEPLSEEEKAAYEEDDGNVVEYDLEV
ncbi:TPA: DsbA family protein [Candidatus Woesearchaeota archaeon]|nr:DsbA family protein [Candidatus Woesearchaeota archaeon]